MTLSANEKKKTTVPVAVCLILIGIPIAFLLASCISESINAGVPVLMYHEIAASGQTASRYSIPENKFEEQMKLLQSSGYNTITDSDFLEVCKGTRDMPEKPVILTFDDGSPDHYTRVFPLLKKYNFTGVFFIITSRINNQESLTVKQLIEMKEAGMSIQSHSGSSILLDRLAPLEARAEMTQSKTSLEQIFKADTISFCLPGGKYNSALLDQLKDTEYRLVFSSDAGTNPIEEKPFLIKRLEIRGTATGFARFSSPCRISMEKFIQKCKRTAKRLKE